MVINLDTLAEVSTFRCLEEQAEEASMTEVSLS